MVILFGSYAKNKYVDYDQRIEFGTPTYYMSDYDLLVLTRKQIGAIQYSLYAKIILLYDSGQYKLARRRKLDFAEIKERAQKYFDRRFDRGISFLRNAHHDIEDGDLLMCAFNLHQTTENLLHTISLVFILYSPKNHDLDELIRSCKAYTIELCRAFPRNTPEEERLFDLLQRSYIESRYNPDFEITKTDIEALVPKVERLRDIVEKICREQIAFYGHQIKK